MTSLRRTSRASLVAAVSALPLAGGILPASASSLSSGSSLGSSFGSSQGSGFGSSLPGSSFLGSSEPGADDDAEAESEDPENIIYMIGDGMGYNHVASTNFFETGQSRYQVEGPNDPAQLEEAAGDAVQVYEQDDFHRLSMTTFPEGKSYDPQAAWTDHDYIKQDPTDSAAAGTAMATGTKTTNGSLGVDSSGEALENVSELAAEQGKSAGVVSSVPFSHATPAAWGAHNESRNDYHGIAAEMVASELDVIMGAGHPFFDDNNAQLDVPDYNYVSEETYNALANGETEFTFFDETADFESLAAGNVTEGERYFGLPQVGSTLQHGRDGDAAEPYADEMNGVVDLSTMATGALNALNTNDEGFHLMIEGGAIDWAGHDNDSARDIEETQGFNDAVEAVVNWVETNSSWDETLVIVTADHETGYLSGQDENPEWRAITGQAGQVPNHEWYSEDHTNQVVPFFFRGAGSEDILAATTGTDPVRGDYVDNTTVANLTFENWWARD